MKVGRDTVSQRMRVDCSLPYYLEELLYVPSEQLAESRYVRTRYTLQGAVLAMTGGLASNVSVGSAACLSQARHWTKSP